MFRLLEGVPLETRLNKLSRTLPYRCAGMTGQSFWQRTCSVDGKGPRPDLYRFIYLGSYEKPCIRRRHCPKCRKIQATNIKCGRANKNTSTSVVIKRKYRKRMCICVRNRSDLFELQLWQKKLNFFYSKLHILYFFIFSSNFLQNG